ncbi:unnamed protein product [Fraxinus pennsylvanica]|uniref:Uncharacterized protein n=1 Tax=Fraxinus pennsylvanica TaxID=56036 RepID=A0AAD1ZZL5_9LAMI|nr:unnamed protein product [Fraxinus pennsylvanica]
MLLCHGLISTALLGRTSSLALVFNLRLHQSPGSSRPRSLIGWQSSPTPPLESLVKGGLIPLRDRNYSQSRSSHPSSPSRPPFTCQLRHGCKDSAGKLGFGIPFRASISFVKGDSRKDGIGRRVSRTNEIQVDEMKLAKLDKIEIGIGTFIDLRKQLMLLG